MPKGIRKLQVTFGETHLTHFGGIFLIHQFCQKLKLKWIFQSYIKFYQQNNRYTVAEMILCLIYTIIIGLGRVYTTRILRYNGSFQDIVGLKSFPYFTTLRNFLLRLTPKVLQQITTIHDSYRLKMFQYSHEKQTSIILDADLEVIPVYGRLEGTKIAYNPRKPGRPSFYPIFCFEAHTQEVWHGKFRAGEPTGQQLKEFIKECFQKLPDYIYRIRFRGDAKFFKKEVIELLEEKKAGYAIVAPSNLFKSKFSGLKYHEFRKGWEAAEFTHQPARWKKFCRFVVIRRPIPEQPEVQFTLFKLKKHAYQVIVSNLPLSPESVYRFYLGRCRQEGYIKELKLSFYIIKITTKKFLANEIYFHLHLFAYNIVNWFKILCLPKQFQKWTLQTIRTELLVLPAKLVNVSRQNILRLPTGHIYDWVFQYAMNKIEKIKSSEFCTFAKKSK